MSEACVADALRRRAECPDGARMLQLPQKSKDGFEEEMNGIPTRLDFILYRNKFASGGDPSVDGEADCSDGSGILQLLQKL